MLMKKFSKKLVSKVVYVKILKSSSSDLLDCFLDESGWELLNAWFSEAIRACNWPLCTELLQLLSQCPISAERLKENADQNHAPKLVKQLSLDSRVDAGVRHLATSLCNTWMSIVSSSQVTPAPRSLRLTRSVIVPTNNSALISQSAPAQHRVLVAVHTSTEEIINMGNMTVASSGMMNTTGNITINTVRPSTNSQIITQSDPYDMILPAGATLQYSHPVISSNNAHLYGALDTDMDIDDLVDKTLNTNNTAPVSSIVNNDGAGVSILQGMADELSETLKKEVQDEIKKEKVEKKRVKLASSSDKERSKDKSRDKERSSKDSSRSKDRDKDRSKDKDKDRKHSSDEKRRREKEKQREKERKEKKRDSKPFREAEMRDSVDSSEKQRIKALAEKMRQEVKALPKIPKVPKKEEPVKQSKDLSSNINTKKPSFNDLMEAMENPTTKTVKAAPIRNKNRDLLASLSDEPHKPVVKKDPKKISRLDHLLSVKTEDKSKIIIKEPEKKVEVKVDDKKEDEKKSVKKRPAPAEEESKLKIKSASQLKDSPAFGDILSTIIPDVPKKKKIKFSDLKAQKEAESQKEEDKDESEDKMETKPATFSFYGEGNEINEDNNEDEEKADSPKKDHEVDEDLGHNSDSEKPIVEEYTGTREVHGILVINKGSKRTRRIQWRPEEKLVDVEYFEVEEGERVNVNKLKFEEQRKKELEFEKMRMKSKDVNYEQDERPWVAIGSVQLTCDLPEIEYGANSRERKEQQLRETSTLQALFFNKSPTDPLEPDSGLTSRLECKPIPLEDTSGEEEINDYSGDGWPEPVYDQYMASQPPPVVASGQQPPTANNILQNLIGAGAPMLGGNQQAVDDALFAAQKAAAETLLKQGLLPPVFMDQNVPPGVSDNDDGYGGEMMEHDDLPPQHNMNHPPPGMNNMGWRGPPPPHHNNRGPMHGPPGYRRGGNGPMNRMNNMGGGHNDFNRGGFGGRGMPPRGHFQQQRGFHNRPPNGNFGNNHNSGRGRRPCKFWMETGSCRHEDQCGFLHTPPHHR